MRWARIVAGLGVVMMLAAFAIGTEVRPSAVRDGAVIECPATLYPSWSDGSYDSDGPARPLTALQRRTQTVCGPHEAVVHGVVIGGLVAGGLALLVGWTALRESEIEADAKTGAETAASPV